jgi:hypothetical protein
MIPEQGVPMIEFTSLTKRYGAGQAVLDSLNLTISKGEFVSLIGPSGCGKVNGPQADFRIGRANLRDNLCGWYDAEKRTRDHLLHFS